jgi:membrane associated rhomboid family serine protease
VVVRVQRDGAERRLTVEEFEAAITHGDVPEDQPVSVDGRWMRAADWPAWQSLRASTTAQLHGLWHGRQVAWITAVVTGLIVQIYLFVPALAARGLIAYPSFLTRDTTAILERGEGWRLFTYALLHGGPDHLLSNAAGLAVACWGLERMIGRMATLVVLLASIVTGGVASALLLPQIQSLGISGGDFGVLGACAVLSLRYLEFVPRGSRAAFGLGGALLTAQFLYGGVNQENVDTPCHLGGLVAGMALGLVVRPNVVAWQRWNRGVAGVTAILLCAAMAAPMAFGVRMIPLTAYEADGVTASRPAWWTVQVGRAGLGGYGNADRSSTVILETSRQSAVFDTDRALAGVLLRVQRMDPEAVLAESTADSGLVRYQSEGEPRVLRLRVAIRGLYTTLAGVDVAEGSRMESLLVREVLEDLALETPDEIAEAVAGADSPSAKTRLAAAVAAAELGAPDHSAASFAAERARGNPARVDVAEFTVLAALAAPEARPRIDKAIAEWPDDRRVQAAAVRALGQLGDSGPARLIATRLLQTAEGDRAIRSAERLLEEVGGTLLHDPPPAED